MTKKRADRQTADLIAERRLMLQRILDLELALSACVTMLGGETRITDYQVVAAGQRPLEYRRVEGATILTARLKP